MSLFRPLSLKLIAKKPQSVYLWPIFTELKSTSQREIYWTFPTIASLRWNSRAWKSTTFHRSYLQKYCEPSSEIFWRISSRFQLRTMWISDSEPSHKQIYSTNSTMTCLWAWKIPNFHRCYLLKYCEPRSEIFRQPSSRFQLRTLEISASEAS